jgi:hypothetical protein
MSLDLIIEQEIRKVARQKLIESNTYGFPEGKVDSGKVVSGGEGGNWGGSMDKALQILDIARDCKGGGDVVSSQKRSRVKTKSGNVSDHYVGNLSAYAVDIPARGDSGDKLLACIMKKWNDGSNSNYKGGKWLNVNKDGYRYQFGWRVSGHYDHIHIGVKKNGGKITVDTSQSETDDETSDQTNLKIDTGGSVLKGLSGWKSFFGFTDEPTTVGSSEEDQSQSSDDTSNTITSINDYKITSPSSSDNNFYSEVFKKIGAPNTPQNLLFFYAWRQAEGAKSTFNPFNTTHKKEGSTFWNCLKRKEGKCLGGVRNYKSESDGIDATAKTITNGNYDCIVSGLKKDIGAINIATKCPSELKKWGTRKGIERVLKTKNIAPPPISTSKVKEINEELTQEIYDIKDIIKKVL